METLLEKAKKMPVNTRGYGMEITDEHIELALAWVNDEINLRQIGRALGKKDDGSAYPFLARALKAHLRKTK